MQDNFKTQAFGFNKKDVINYIYALASEKEQNEEASAKRISELESQVETLTTHSTRIGNENKSLSEQLSEARAELADSNEQRSRLYEEMNTARRTLLDNEREFNIKNEQISKLIAENEQYAEKCAKYSEITRDVGKTIMEAKRLAADMIEKAEIRAAEIQRIAERTAAETMIEIDTASAEIANLKSNVADMARICDSRAKTLEINLKSATQAINAAVKKASGGCENAAEPEANDGEIPPQQKEFF